mgnify:CR=1 FL=1
MEHVYTEQVVWCGGGTRFGTRFESEESQQPCGLARLVWVVHGSFELKFNLIKKTVFFLRGTKYGNFLNIFFLVWAFPLYTKIA